MFAGRLFVLCCFLTKFSWASTKLEIKVTPWYSNCKSSESGKELDCGLPKSVSQEIKHVVFPVWGDDKETVSLSKEFLNLGTDSNLVLLKLYEVPKSKRAPRYYQIQIIWLDGTRAECHASLSSTHQVWPPLTCVQYVKSKKRKYGLLAQAKQN